MGRQSSKGWLSGSLFRSKLWWAKGRCHPLGAIQVIVGPIQPVSAWALGPWTLKLGLQSLMTHGLFQGDVPFRLL